MYHLMIFQPTSSAEARLTTFPRAAMTPVDIAGSLELPGKSRWRAELIGAALLMGLLAAATTKGPHHVQGCSIDTVPPRFGGETETSMRLARGMECSIWLRTGRVSIEDLAIVKSPANGSLRMRGRSGVIYKAAKNVTGDDAFAFEVKGHDGALAKSALIRVRVNVH